MHLLTSNATLSNVRNRGSQSNRLRLSRISVKRLYADFGEFELNWLDNYEKSCSLRIGLRCVVTFVTLH